MSWRSIWRARPRSHDNVHTHLIYVKPNPEDFTLHAVGTAQSRPLSEELPRGRASTYPPVQRRVHLTNRESCSQAATQVQRGEAYAIVAFLMNVRARNVQRSRPGDHRNPPSPSLVDASG